MPYPGIPENLWPKMDRCVSAVLKDNPEYDKGRAVAICRSALNESEAGSDATDETTTAQESVTNDVFFREVTAAALQTDAEGNLSGEIIVEGLSDNGKNFYTLEALNTLADVLQNAPIYVNHDTKEQREKRPEGDVTRLIGRLPIGAENFSVTKRADGRHVATFKNGRISTSPSDRWAMDRIQQCIIGDLSIFIRGEGSEQKDGTFRVTRFIPHHRNSVDLVTTGAAGGKAKVS